jgi:sigma-B regulation protein RsbU (phosphoserine phosphatase)
LSRIRHDLRTPINHIIGYCELLQEEEQVPAAFQSDLERIHSGGRQLLALLAEYFDEKTFASKAGDLHHLCHELRTPVNHIIGYSEILQEAAEDSGKTELLPDLRRIGDAARTWLTLMEEYLIVSDASEGKHPGDTSGAVAHLLEPGIDLVAPAPRSAALFGSARGNLLVVDDDEVNRDMLVRRLTRYGYDVTVARNGLEALQMARARNFDLVLLDMVMPGLDGYQVLTRLKSDSARSEIPVIMISALDQENSIARCIEAGAEDYIAKPFNPVFLRARIGACLEKMRLRQKERQTYEALQASQKQLAGELAEAAAYVRSLLPQTTSGAVEASWCFQPSAQLGGDAFDYYWLDQDHFVLYLMDVCGHGVGAALLSVSVMNVLRARALPGVDFLDPGSVLGALNQMFQMDRHNSLFSTIWYGVYRKKDRELVYASGGHPPALLQAAPEGKEMLQLATSAPPIGCFEGSAYRSAACPVPPNARLYLFSDGVYEVCKPDGTMWSLEEFTDWLPGVSGSGNKATEDVLSHVRELRGGELLEDDFSLVRFAFP